jgi:tetratricopeptide (TPR) repeat protein
LTLDRLEITPFAVIVGDLLRSRDTGYLTVIDQRARKVLYWSQGEIVLASSTAPEESLGDFLVRRGVISVDRAFEMTSAEPTEVVSLFHEAGLLDLSLRQTLLREWLISVVVPLFSVDEGTAAFTHETAIEPARRVFLQSTAAVILDGIRSITNGLILRRSIGDLKRDIAFSNESRFSIDNVPLTEAEHRIAASLVDEQPIELFLKQFPSESGLAAKVIIGMLALGIYRVVDVRSTAEPGASMDDMQRDLELLSAIGPDDPRSLRAVRLSRQLNTIDHYQILDIPRAATRAQIVAQAETMKKRYDPATYPPPVRDSIHAIRRKIDEAAAFLTDAGRRPGYDKLLSQHGGRKGGQEWIQQRVNQRTIAQQNMARARELSVTGDYYGAIVLLKQAVHYEPDYVEAWFLLGSCQERNPKWRRDAAESFQQVLSLDPNHVEALISLGDLYRAEGMGNRAQSCYEDVLKISPENQQAKNRLTALKKR